MGEHWIIIITIALSAIFALVLVLWAIGLLARALLVAGILFAWAAAYGFIGVALYVILWVVATPFMIVVCIVGGVLMWVADRAATEAPEHHKVSVRELKRRRKLGYEEYWSSERLSLRTVGAPHGQVPKV